MAVTCEECGESCPSAGSLRLHLLDHKEGYSSPQPVAAPPGYSGSELISSPPLPLSPFDTVPARRSGLKPWHVVAIVGAAIFGLVTMLGIAVTVLGTSEDAADPVAFESPEGRFRAEFPGTPVAQSATRETPLGTVTITIHQAVSDDYAFGVAFADYPNLTGVDTNALLDGAAEGAAAEVSGKVTTKSFTTVLGLPAIDFVVTGKQNGQDFEDRSRALLANNRMYLIQGVTRPGEHREPYDRLLATFAILPG